MTNPTPTPAPDLAAIIEAAQGACACLCPGPECSDIEASTCPSVTALCAAASRPAPPVADGEVARMVNRLEDESTAQSRAGWDSRCGSADHGIAAALASEAASLLLSLSSRLSAAEARAEQAESLRRDKFVLGEERRAEWLRAEAAESACTALRERVGALTEALRAATDALTDAPAPEHWRDQAEWSARVRAIEAHVAAPATPRPLHVTVNGRCTECGDKRCEVLDWPVHIHGAGLKCPTCDAPAPATAMPECVKTVCCAAPPAPAGEVGELVERGNKLERDLNRSAGSRYLREPVVMDEDTIFKEWLVKNWPRIRAALTAQAAALKEAEGRAVQMTARWETAEEACDNAVTALGLLGCRMGKHGWESPQCGGCGANFMDGVPCSDQSSHKRKRYPDFVPITAPAKGEGET